MAEAVSDMSQAFFSAADMHASLGHMPMACTMCVLHCSPRVYALQRAAAHVSGSVFTPLIAPLSPLPSPPLRCVQLASQLRACNFFTDAAAAYLRASQ